MSRTRAQTTFSTVSALCLGFSVLLWAAPRSQCSLLSSGLQVFHRHSLEYSDAQRRVQFISTFVICVSQGNR
ncbi:hypothetical protein R3P38DRAFT_2993723 [Favolaschia claudopus]|uniref:Secreted protein n=1 Tax=Favolaschia claudopus TaxID=2862362 RepID=A0AAW0AS79_9AGAR